jgi:hypothetical protein
MTLSVMTDLSPAAQAVFNAAWACPIILGDHRATRRRQLAAAFRAAADQVVEEPIEENFDCFNTPWGAATSIRRDILAIAAELEANR